MITTRCSPHVGRETFYNVLAPALGSRTSSQPKPGRRAAHDVHRRGRVAGFAHAEPGDGAAPGAAARRTVGVISHVEEMKHPDRGPDPGAASAGGRIDQRARVGIALVQARTSGGRSGRTRPGDSQGGDGLVGALLRRRSAQPARRATSGRSARIAATSDQVFEGRGLEDGARSDRRGQRRRGGSVDGQDDASGTRASVSRASSRRTAPLGDGVVLEDLDVLAAHAGLGHTQDACARAAADGQTGRRERRAWSQCRHHCSTIACNASEASQRAPFSQSLASQGCTRPTPARGRRGRRSRA